MDGAIVDHSRARCVFGALISFALSLIWPQNVLIVGGSFSGAGIAADLAPFATSVTMSVRVSASYTTCLSLSQIAG